ncbi:MAG: STAS domain-containing protein [Leptospiraceae bacterium]|nr:STAS domain-containing protein [Leptospiraceae bacterium]MCP5500389.1 STAS domain-containing protein [Leptospiraceae bacterium]
MPIFGTRHTEEEIKEGEFFIPQVMNADSLAEIYKKLDALPAGRAADIHLNFEKCKRIEASGVKALVELDKKITEAGKKIYIYNVQSTPYKALKLTGKFEHLTYPHRGDK